MGYLKCHRNFKLTYNRGKLPESESILECFCDASFAPDKDRKSITGYAIYYNGNLIDYYTKKQPKISDSAAAAEMLALDMAVKRLNKLKSIIKDLGYCVDKTHVYEDNEAVITILNNEYFHTHTPLDITYKALQEKLNKEFTISYIRSEENLADAFTKCLHAPKFNESMSKILERPDLNGETFNPSKLGKIPVDANGFEINTEGQ
ncbi:uncharacterized protein J8A68_000564 [[Candida] subhashii]|uniref:RNase H type-1 domain-containing protein n=1 Tax=[Candida] subhashii TaxID=561895 RepID=A0A8J5URY8_9ASCO|nr:uncharacterized protein J8A68_000564 [[Candida] subhashii]KAG7665941.1 hypothetical protein J8A68_000564 [[Candida] subhashii]